MALTHNIAVIYLCIESEITICGLTMMEICGLEVPLQEGGEEGDFCNWIWNLVQKSSLFVKYEEISKKSIDHFSASFLGQK